MPDFNLLSCKLDNFTFKVLYRVIIILILYLKKMNMEHATRPKTLAKRSKTYSNIHNTLTVPYGKSEMVSFASPVMKNIVVFSFQSKFPVKLICRIAFGSASSACCLLESIAIIL